MKYEIVKTNPAHLAKILTEKYDADEKVPGAWYIAPNHGTCGYDWDVFDADKCREYINLTS